MSPRRWGRGGVLALAVVSSLLIFGVPSAVAAFHGVATAKSTVSPVKIGDPYTSSAFVGNTVDTGHDTIVVTGLSDVVFASGGNVQSGNILSSVGLIFGQTGGQGTVTCVGGSGAGTVGSPYVGATSCTLTFGATITTTNFTHYTVVAGDFNINPVTHRLADQITWDWHNTCQFDPDQDCTTDPQQAQAGASALVLLLNSTTTTDIHNAAHQVVTNVAVGSTVHDFVTVTGQPGSPNPSGNVTIDWFLNGTCTGTPQATGGPFALNAAGQVDATAFNFTVNSAGQRAFRAHYAGDATYLPSDGPCEPLNVVDANIQITPNGVNPVGTTHTFTAHVNVNNGSGFVNAPDGTQISFTIDSGPGSFTTPNPCTTSGGTGSCTITLTSAVTGTTVVSAHTDVAVGGVSLHRDTNGQGANSGPATKQWVDANIQITPATANNPVGSNHVLTITVNALGGTLGNGTATASIVSGPGSFVGSPSCNYTGGGATASCTVTITSATAGTTVISATSNIPVSGISITRTTGTAANTASGGSGNASKNWADDTIVTRVLDAANNDVTNTTVPSGTVVHDEATVAKAAGTPAAVPAPTGTVTFTLFNNSSCNGTVVATDPNKPLNAAGVATSVDFTTPDSGGLFSYLAHYNGDANYPAKDAACEPFQVNAVKGEGRITGGGSIFDTVDGVPDTRITHGFELRCDPNDKRQSLEINWAGGNNFHLEKLINSVVCFDDPATQPPPPPGTVFDTYAGNTLFQGHTGYHGFGYAVGTGICNKLPATIYFILIDAGEPGTGDIAEYHITGGCTLNVGPEELTFGNHQFHKR